MPGFDAFKAILIRFETKDLHWKGLLLLTFSVILLRKLKTTSL